MEAEIWRNLPTDGLEHYQVSNLGNVRNTSYKGTEKIRSMSQCTDKNGYFVVASPKRMANSAITVCTDLSLRHLYQIRRNMSK